jgi:hypothetical protein
LLWQTYKWPPCKESLRKNSVRILRSPCQLHVQPITTFKCCFIPHGPNTLPRALFPCFFIILRLLFSSPRAPKTFFHHLVFSGMCSSPTEQQPVLSLRQSAPSHPKPRPLPALHKAAKNDQPITIRPQDGNCNFAERLSNSQHSRRLIPGSLSFTISDLFLSFAQSKIHAQTK